VNTEGGPALLGRAGMARARAGQGRRRAALAGASLGLLSAAAFVALVAYAGFNDGSNTRGSSAADERDGRADPALYRVTAGLSSRGPPRRR
jgi:hypothetical protein